MNCGRQCETAETDFDLTTPTWVGTLQHFCLYMDCVHVCACMFNSGNTCLPPMDVITSVGGMYIQL